MYLANLCNSITVEIYGDIIQVSHGFEGCQMLEYIADTCNLEMSPIKYSYHLLKISSLIIKQHQRYPGHRISSLGGFYSVEFEFQI
jgi:hypothetical protein